MTKWLRTNIGVITSSIGLLLLVLLMFGNPLEINTVEYWQSVYNNIMSLSLLAFGLVLVNTTIKQGISEQALSTGLNTEETTKKFQEHKALIKQGFSKQKHLQKFLKEYNNRETEIKRQEFLIDNDINEAVFKKTKLTRKEKRLKRKYFKIKTIVTPSSIKWATTTIIYDKKGRIQTLNKYRLHRAIKGVILGTFTMFGMTLIARGLFMEVEKINWLAQLLQLVVYILTIAITAIFDVIKNYEKGAFGVPNELDEINTIWLEFLAWPIPVEPEVKPKIIETIKEEEKEIEKTINIETDIQEEPVQIEMF